MLTIFHKTRLSQKSPEEAMKRQRPRLDHVLGRVKVLDRLCHVQVVGQGDSVALGDGLDFVLAVAVEGCPLDGRAAFRSPVKLDAGPGVADGEVSTLELRGQADDQGADLAFGAWSVDVFAE